MTRTSPQGGFTLVELLVGIVVAGIVGAATLSITIHQERTAYALDDVMNTRRAVREGADVLRYDLRAIAPALGAIYRASDTFVEFRMTTGFSVLCALDSARTSIVVPARAATGTSLTSWIISPEPGDTVMLYHAAPDPDSARWDVAVLASTPAVGRTCPVGLDPGGAEVRVPALTARLTAPLPPGVAVGAALRFVRRARYELYRGGDGSWYLGFADCLQTRTVACATLQPVSGPYPPNGVRFRFIDSTATPTSDPRRVARIEVVIRGESIVRRRVSGLPDVFKDSVALIITPRN